MLQGKWQYLQRGIADEFALVEQAVQEKFMPALLDGKVTVPESLQTLSGLSVKSAGLGLPNPMTTAVGCFGTSQWSGSRTGSWTGGYANGLMDRS